MIRKSATALYKAGYCRRFICDMVVVIVMLPRTMTSIYHQQKACIHAEDGALIVKFTVIYRTVAAYYR